MTTRASHLMWIWLVALTLLCACGGAESEELDGDESDSLKSEVAEPSEVIPEGQLLPQDATNALPTSPRIDLTVTPGTLFRDKKLHETTVMQSFSIDETHHRIFVAQIRNGAENSGNLCINELDLEGNLLGHMHLNGFGHGVSIAAESAGRDTYLWTEIDASSDGYGTKLTRFKYANGKTLDHNDQSLPKYSPISGKLGSYYTAAIDPTHKMLAVRYHRARVAVYDLTEATQGKFIPIIDVALPKNLGVFQGQTLYGQYLYLLDGESYTNAPEGNSYLTSVDFNSGQEVQRAITRVGKSLVYREPEGMSVYHASAGHTRLVYGFASGKHGDRRCNLFYKEGAF